MLLEGEFSLALDCEFVVGDLVAELANGVGGVFGGEEAVEMGDYGTIVTLLHTYDAVAESIAFESLIGIEEIYCPADSASEKND